MTVVEFETWAKWWGDVSSPHFNLSSRQNKCCMRNWRQLSRNIKFKIKRASVHYYNRRPTA